MAKVTPENAYYFYHYDGLGSTVAITDSNGDVVNTYAYSPYGLVGGQETIPNPFKYVGRFGVMDEGNGLYFMRARYYDPEVGRFINKDPIGFLGGLNLYAYVGNNALNLVDPLGLTDDHIKYIDINITVNPLGIVPGALIGGLLTTGNPIAIYTGAILGSLGGTGGVMIDRNTDRIYPYIGGGFAPSPTPGWGVTVTYSKQHIVPGWNVGLQGVIGIAGQVGYSFGKEGDCREQGGWFTEKGIGFPPIPNTSLTVYYVFDLYKKKNKK